MQDRPSIIEVMSKRLELRRAGKEYLGLCPFHADKNPSFSVSEEKGLFHCFGCGESGDVIRFVMIADGLTFPEALRALGLESSGRPLGPNVSTNRKAATLLAAWLNRQHLLIAARCRELSAQITIADEISDRELSASLREWQILSDLHDDLVNPAYSAEFWEQRQSIEQITADVAPESLPEFPPLTESYRKYLRSVVKC